MMDTIRGVPKIDDFSTFFYNALDERISILYDGTKTQI